MDSFRRIALFISTIYACFWFAAPVATAAPMNDLLMMQLLEDYTQIDNKVAGIIDKKMRLQLWYISEDLAALPLL